MSRGSLHANIYRLARRHGGPREVVGTAFEWSYRIGVALAPGEETWSLVGTVNMKPATAKSWRRLPEPAQKEELGFSSVFTDEEAERLRLGLVPRGMDDKWFIYMSDGWLRFHRSWTGAFIYALRLEGSPAGVRVVESWVSRDPSQYTESDTEYDRKLVRFLVDAFLLEKADAVFPLPRGSEGTAPGAVQHSSVGRAHVEAPPDETSGREN